jgi:hypothetical protein
MYNALKMLKETSTCQLHSGLVMVQREEDDDVREEGSQAGGIESSMFRGVTPLELFHSTTQRRLFRVK